MIAPANIGCSAEFEPRGDLGGGDEVWVDGLLRMRICVSQRFSSGLWGLTWEGGLEWRWDISGREIGGQGVTWQGMWEKSMRSKVEGLEGFVRLRIRYIGLKRGIRAAYVAKGTEVGRRKSKWTPRVVGVLLFCCLPTRLCRTTNP